MKKEDAKAERLKKKEKIEKLRSKEEESKGNENPQGEVNFNHLIMTPIHTTDASPHPSISCGNFPTGVDLGHSNDLRRTNHQFRRILL
jgi:hypothetical protein